MNWLQIIIPIFTGFCGYFIKHYLDLKKEAEKHKFENKLEHYKNLILCLKSLKEGKTDNMEFLWFEYSFLWLHAPDTVIKSFNGLLHTIKSGSNKTGNISPLIGNLLISIRRDMGFPKTSLKSENFEGKL